MFYHQNSHCSRSLTPRKTPVAKSATWNMHPNLTKTRSSRIYSMRPGSFLYNDEYLSHALHQSCQKTMTKQFFTTFLTRRILLCAPLLWKNILMTSLTDWKKRIISGRSKVSIVPSDLELSHHISTRFKSLAFWMESIWWTKYWGQCT